jgi:hypothetical protein
MSDEYKTSLYVAKVESELFPELANLRNGVWGFLKRTLTATEKLTFIENSQNVVFNGTLIGFRVRNLPEEKKILLSFFPYGQDIAMWGKSRNMKAVEDVRDLCDNLGATISARTEAGSLVFERMFIDTNNLINIDDWEVVLASTTPTEKHNLKEFLNESVRSRYDSVFNKVSKDNKFLIFTQSFLRDKKPVEILKVLLQDFGEVDGPRSLLTAKEFGEKYHSEDSGSFIFVENELLLKQWYKTQKVYFDSNRIPTQFVEDKTILNKLTQWPGVKANLVLEIMTKMGKKPIVLRAPEEIITSEGFLCLSDIESTTRNLFGALFTYSKEGLEKEEEVQIYEDIDFTVHKEKIDIPTPKIDILADRIWNLIGKKIAIDIIITKEWSDEELSRLITKLKNKGIIINRVYYVSSRTSRFIDDYVIDGFVEKTRFPYLKIGDKIAFLRTSTELRIYANISHLFIKLIYPENESLEESDLKKILWLVKKRIYRIQEFGVLKIPEPINIFKNVRKMYLGELKETLTMPLRLLI